MTQRKILVPLVVVFASACASSNFVSSWKSPTARPMEVAGATVAAVVMMGDVGSRKKAEDKLASELTARGAKGVPMYSIMPDADLKDEAVAREALKGAQVQGVVVIRPTPNPATGRPVDYSVPPYSTYWNSGFYAHGHGRPWIDPGGVPYDMVVSVDTLVYSLEQNQLVWAGQSKKTNPATLNELVTELAEDTAKELRDQGLIAP